MPIFRLPGFAGLAALACLSAATGAEPTQIGEPARRPLVARPPADAPLIQPAGCGKAAAAILAELNRTDGDTHRPLGPAGLADTDLLHNNVELDLSVSGNDLTIVGSNTMTVRSLVDGLTTFDIRLRSNFTITAATVDASPVTVQNIDTVTRRVLLGTTFNTGDTFDVRIEFNGVAVSRGFGSIEVDYAGGQPVIASLSEPYYAYTWWPCKDGAWGAPGDNADKATLDMALIAPSNMRSVSNGVLTGVDTLPGGRSRYRWHSDYPISTYLVMLASHPYNTWTETFTYDDGQTVHSMPVEFNIYPSDDTPGNRAAWGKAVTMLGVLSDLYGLYPFINEKYGIYEFPFAGGMEHQTNTGQGTFLEYVTAHELGHQWFGDMITCRTWSDIWLNEGFATYTEALWNEFKPGSSGHPALVTAMNNRRPDPFTAANQSVYVYQTDDVARMFAYDTTYLKAAWVVHMLRGVMGDAAFFQFLADYRAQFAFGAATTADFEQVAENTSGLDLTAFFDQWVYQAGQLLYTFGWENANINGQDYVRLRLQQIQSGSMPTFVMPVDIALDGLPTTVQNSARTQHYLIPVPAPVGTVSLDPDTWILIDGATQVVYIDGPPKVVATTPAPGQFVPDAPQIEVVFSDPVNTSAGDFTLTGPDGNVAVNMAQPEPGRVVLTPTATLGNGAYTLTIADTVTFGGAALDGEIVADALPSGDGLPGGDAAIGFTVAAQGCNPADIAQPFGVLDLNDISAFIAAFVAQDPAADLAEPFGVFDLSDLSAFTAAFLAGCP